MNGILIIDKPPGLTSHDVVSRVRRILNTRRVGHTGTLDPFATGVLVILVGKATRLAQFLDKDEKEYEAIVQFGYETDSGDLTGTRIKDCGLRMQEVSERLAAVNWDKVLPEFRGRIEQVPPMYSAKKVAGRKLYEIAREGREIERKSVEVVIHELEILSTNQTSAGLRVICSAGTYIRTLAEDIGRKIGLGAHLTGLRRTRAGKFELSESVKLENLEHEQTLLPLRKAVSHLPSVVLDPGRIEKTRNGLSTRYAMDDLLKDQPLQMIDERGELIAIGFYNESERAVQPKVVLI